MTKIAIFPNFEAIDLNKVKPGDLIYENAGGELKPKLVLNGDKQRGLIGIVDLSDSYSFKMFQPNDLHAKVFKLTNEWRFKLCQTSKAKAVLSPWNEPPGLITVSAAGNLLTGIDASYSGHHEICINLETFDQEDLSKFSGDGSCLSFSWRIEINDPQSGSWIEP
jgi:hypothetical protein